jgi:hypothetical protein
MATRKTPPRSWDVDMLLVLGKREGVKAKHLKAIPVLILEKWVRGGREEDVANYVWTKDMAKRLVSSGLVHSFKAKGTSVILASLTMIQGARNLTRPPLIEYRGGGMFWVNLPRYEPLLQEYRQKYRELYPVDYKKLFPPGTDPDWEQEPSRSKLPPRTLELEVTRKRADVQPQSLENKIVQVVREYEGAWEERVQDADNRAKALEEESQKLKAELNVFKASQRMIVDEELRNDCAKFLEDRGTYIDAIRRASVVLEERLKKAVGTGGDKLQYGGALVRYALAEDTGKLVISDISNEQKGVFELFSGAFAFVRNPPAHKKMQYTELEAWQTISLIDYLLLLLRQARPR